MRRRLASLVLLACLFLTTGCWNRAELNDLRIAIAGGIDRAGDKWEISYQTIIPSSMASGTGGSTGSSTQPAIYVFSMVSDTIFGARMKSNLEASRKLYVAHAKVIVVGREAAERGLEELVDLFLRNSEARETVQLLITDGKAKDLLNKMVPPEKLPGESYSNILAKESRFISNFPKKTIFDFALSLHSDSKSIGIPVASFVGDENTDEELEKMRSLDVLKDISPPLSLRLTRLGVFSGDRLVGYLSGRESMGLSWLTDQVKETELSFPCPQAKNKHNSIEITSSKTKLNPVRAGTHYTMLVSVNLNGNLMESTCNQDLSKSEVIHDMEKNIEKEVRDQIFTGWDAVRQMGVDVTGYADIIHRSFPKEWKAIQAAWPQEFRRMDIQVQVNAAIRRPGLIQKTEEQIK
ncbi:spore germination protein KC [Paenibacillus rhizosphaerae]|uniref:Spore germination protein KC n=1 Tax=Paenibacillus rhizosphaerae TaxID=297318 RepID=A0A839TK01_9BACL|nr:Ger(x)C family spore germination protein [Paenibacillus rhizosphaerae]MBB3125689.1 spore germination protein KC [Paenibacillus rhizosphaerae]